MRFLSLLLLVFSISSPWLRADDGFEKHIRPLFLEKCLSCHGPTKASGGLRLDSRQGLLKGGDSGVVVREGKADESLLIKAISYRDELRMPPRKQLSADEVHQVKAWINRGMPWPGGSIGTVQENPSASVLTDEKRKWWSFQPVARTSPPAVKNTAWIKNDVDRFILAKLEANQLTPSAPADRRTLLRRVTYDLTGLPPSAEEMDAFLKDTAPDAFPRVVERLLASPAYGERWGRHWLDLVRYADTAGETSDHPVPQAWRYRNWVIESMNHDLPYDQFIREQIAGDLLHAQDPPEEKTRGIVATGFLAIARRFDFDCDKSMYLTHEDAIDTLGRAFLGLSISCARCHDHKYDPITSRDYYGLYGILESTQFSSPGCEAKQQPHDLIPLPMTGEVAKIRNQIQKELANLENELKSHEENRSRRIKTLLESQAQFSRLLAQGEIPDGGKQDFLTGPGKPIETIDVQVSQGIQLLVSPLKNHGADTTLLEWEIVEQGGQGRKWNLKQDVIQDLLAGNPHADSYQNRQVWWFLNPNPAPDRMLDIKRGTNGHKELFTWHTADTPALTVNTSEATINAWTGLPGRSLFVHPGPTAPIGISWVSPIQGKVTITGHVRDVHPGGTDGVGWSLRLIAQDHGSLLRQVAESGEKSLALQRQRKDLLAKMPVEDVAYAVKEGKIANTKIHLRGDPEKLGPEIPRRWLQLLGGQEVRPEEGSGRRQLAQWLSSANNPLTARVMVNRIWLHHFGKGLVQTPNDFGLRGLPPTHPELLDWLADRFIASGWSIKAMHRLLLNSAVYQQGNLYSGSNADRDGNNQYLWHFERRRLSAEELRDSLLFLSGQLDSQMGQGHPIPPASTWSFSQHGPFSADYPSDKRSIYLITLRNRRHPFFALFDGADPNATTPQRQVTTVPTQALYFLNDPFFHHQADRIASKVLTKSDPIDRFNAIDRLILQRLPSDEERAGLLRFVQSYPESLKGLSPGDQDRSTWSALVRIILASNEFLFLE